MATTVEPQVADAIAALETAWSAFSAAPIALGGAQPSPDALLAAAAALRAQMPDVDPGTGLLPWEADPELDSEAPEGPEWVGAAFEVLYEVHVLGRQTSLSNHAHHLLELANAVSDLVTWHPRYDAETGRITP